MLIIYVINELKKILVSEKSQVLTSKVNKVSVLGGFTATKCVGSLVSRTYMQTAYLMWNCYVSDKAVFKSDIKGD